MINYFNGKLSPGFVSLYSGRIILRISVALLGLFVPIFLYELFNFNLNYVIYYYLIGSTIYAFSVAWGAKYLNKVGLRRSLRISILWGALYYLMLYLLDQRVNIPNHTINHQVLILLALSLSFLTLFRVMYWIPMHTDMAKFTDKKNRAKQLSFLEATSVALSAVLPLVAGWVLTRYSYDVLFFIAIIIYGISLVPLATLPETKEKFSWTYLRTWKEFLSRKRRKAILAYMGDGAESAIGIFIWPIFIWELLKGNYFEVGAISSLIVLTTIILQLFVGKFADFSNKRKMLKYGTSFYALGWIFKIFIATTFQIFITSTYHNLTRIFSRTPFDTLNYEQAADEGHYVDEYTVIHEMAIHFGRILMFGIVLILISFLSIQWTFVLAAIASLAMNFLGDEDAIIQNRIKATE